MAYEFTGDDFTKFTEDVLKAEGDQAILTTLLADMQTTVTAAIAKDIATQEKMQRVEAQNQRLLEANASLFQRVGDQLNGGIKGQTGGEEKEDTKTASVKDYMNSYFSKLDEKK